MLFKKAYLLLEISISPISNMHDYAHCLHHGNKCNCQQKKSLETRQVGQTCSKSIERVGTRKPFLPIYFDAQKKAKI